MKSLKTRLAAAFAATSIALGAPLAANAGGLDSLLGWLDLQAALLNVVGNTFDLENIAGPIDVDKIVIKDTADVTNLLQKVYVENIGIANVDALNDSFDNVEVLTDNGEVNILSDILNDSVNQNDIDVFIPVAVDVLSDGTCVIWNCSHCGD